MLFLGPQDPSQTTVSPLFRVFKKVPFIPNTLCFQVYLVQEVGKDPFTLPWEGILCPLVTWESYGQTALSKVFGP